MSEHLPLMRCQPTTYHWQITLIVALYNKTTVFPNHNTNPECSTPHVKFTDQTDFCCPLCQATGSPALMTSSIYEHIFWIITCRNVNYMGIGLSLIINSKTTPVSDSKYTQ